MQLDAFCCLWRNVKTSCHKHFVVVSRHQQTLPLTTSDQCHNLPRSGGAVLITPSRSQRWQHAVKPDIGSESRCLPRMQCLPHLHSTPPLGGFPSKYWHDVQYGKTRIVWLPDGKKLKIWTYLFWHNSWTWQTHRQTHADTACRHRPRLHSIARQKKLQVPRRANLFYTDPAISGEVPVGWLVERLVHSHIVLNEVGVPQIVGFVPFFDFRWQNWNYWIHGVIL